MFNKIPSKIKSMTHISEREQDLPEQEIEKLLEIQAEHPDILSLGPGEPDFSAPKPIIEYTRKIAHKVSHYSPAGGRKDFKEAICKKLKKDNKVHARPENVVATCGSQEALMLATACTLDVSEQIILPNPGYMAFLPTVQIFNAHPVFVELKEENDFEPNPDEIEKLIDKKKTKVILLNSPANPTGNVIRKKILEEIADIAIENDLYIFSDEAYEKILYDGAKHVSIGSLGGMQDHVVTFQTFSKTYAMCGYRLGYASAPEKLANAMKKTHVYTSICAPTISQMLGVKALGLSSKYTHKMVAEYNKRRKVIVKRLNDMGLSTPVPKGAFYTFSNIQHINKSSKKFAYDLLKKQKVAVIPGIDFGNAGEGYIRCSYATDIKIIKQAMDKLEKFVKK